MEISLNFINLKDKDLGVWGTDYPTCVEYVIIEMFKLHFKSSKTVWDRKMFDEEFKRDGSGFFVCFINNFRNNFDKIGNPPEDCRIEFSFDENLKLDLKSKIIGFFIFYTVLDEMHILDITVAKYMQSNGIGSFMVGRILDKYLQEGIKSYFLEVRATNAVAINLYKKFGFKIFLLRKDYYEENKEDALCMVKGFYEG